MAVGVLVWWIVSAMLGQLLVYAAFRPYTDSLLHRIVLGVLSFGTLYAIMMPILRNQGPASVPLYAGLAIGSIAAFTSFYHYVDRWLSSQRGQK